MIQKSRKSAAFHKPVLVLILVTVLAVTSFLDTGTIAYADGESVFNANCAACHSTGTDKVIGPGLAGVGDRGEDYIRESIVDPGAVIADGFANIMPATFGASLSSGDLDDLVRVGCDQRIATEQSTAEINQVQISAPVGDGDADRGENLFTGPTRFENEGPSCAACHSSSGLGALGGGSLGPDLTGAYAKLGDALILWPETVAPMSPIFIERPLTDGEKADLLAFFKSADVTERETAQVISLFGMAVGGLVIIAIFTHLIWRRRLGGVRKQIVGTTSLKRNSSKRLVTGLLSEQLPPSSKR